MMTIDEEEQHEWTDWFSQFEIGRYCRKMEKKLLQFEGKIKGGTKWLN